MSTIYWIRTCQECGHKQQDTNPGNHPTEAYLERKCKKCKSISLDWGKQEDDNNDNDRLMVSMDT